MGQCNNYGNYYLPDIYLSNSSQRAYVNVSNNQSKYYAELAEQYKNEAKELLDSTRYYVETNSGVTEGALEELETSLVNMIGEKATENDITANLNKKISNCLLEIPQRIKYTLEDGTLTIKSGSVVIVPYGMTDQSSDVEVGDTFINESLNVYDTCWDSTNNRFYVWVELQEDIVFASSEGGAVAVKDLILKFDENTVSLINCLNAVSVSSDSSATDSTAVLYNTSENLVKFKNNSTVQECVCTLPLMLTESDSTYDVAEVKQLFNGFGYIGSILWADKGIVVLIPNGRNDNGTLKNTNIVSSGIVLADLSSYISDTGSIKYDTNSLVKGYLSYDPVKNINYVESTGVRSEFVVVGNYATDASGVIISAKFSNAVKLLDTNYVCGKWVKSNISLAQAGTYPTTDDVLYSLENYLPNDGYNYEVFLSCSCQTGTATGNYLYVTVSSSILGGIFICGARTRTNSNLTGAGNIVLPVGTDRTITISANSGYTGTYNLYVKGYRRLGFSS